MSHALAKILRSNRLRLALAVIVFCVVGLVIVTRPSGPTLRVLLPSDTGDMERAILNPRPPVGSLVQHVLGTAPYPPSEVEVFEIQPMRWGARATRVASLPDGSGTVLSPDGTQAAQVDAAGRIEVWAWSDKGLATRRVFTVGTTIAGRPYVSNNLIWDPTGTMLAYGVRQLTAGGMLPNGKSPLALYALDIASGESKKLGEWQVWGGYPVGWSPSGNWLAVKLFPEDILNMYVPGMDTSTLLLVNREDKQVIRSPRGWTLISWPVWSPSDDRCCLLLSESSVPAFRPPHHTLWEFRTKQRQWHRLATYGQVWLWPVCYARDGASLWCLQESLNAPAPVLGILDPDTGHFRPVVDVANHFRGPVSLDDVAVSADGRWLAITLTDDISAIGLLNLDTGHFRLIPSGRLLGLGASSVNGAGALRVGLDANGGQ